jgi:excisionase family DNA binding protein
MSETRKSPLPDYREAALQAIRGSLRAIDETAARIKAAKSEMQERHRRCADILAIIAAADAAPKKPVLPDNIDSDALLNADQAATLLGITVPQLLALVDDGAVKFINVGRGMKRPRYRFERTDLDAFKASRAKIQEHTCRSTEGRGPNFSRSTSSSNVIGFQDARAVRRSAKPKGSKR